MTGGLCVNNQLLIAPGGCAGYLDDETIGYVDGPMGWLTRIYHNGVTTPTVPSTTCNGGYANGGVMAWESPDPDHYGLNSTSGFYNKAAAPLAVGPDGSIAWRIRDSYGPCWVHKLDGSDWKFTDGVAGDVQLLGGDAALWLEGGALRVVGIPTPKTYPGSVWFPHAMIYRGEWWIGYYSSALGLVAHPFNDYSQGFRFMEPGVDAWPVFKTLADGALCCVWSSKIEQHAGQLTKALRSVDDPLDTLLASPPVNVAPYGRSIPQWAYYTYDAGRKYGNYPQEVLNIAWCSGDSPSDVEKANANDQYVITGLELIGQAKRKAFILCTNDYWNAPPLQDQVNAAIPLCVAYNIRMVVYDEKNEKPTLPEWAFPMVRCFREPSESLNEWINRVALSLPTRDCVLLLGVEDRLGQLSPEVIRETALAATELLRKYKQIRLAGWFSYARTAMDANGNHIPPGGAILYPDTWAVVKASYHASEPYNPKDFQIPEIPPIDPPKPPTTGLLRGRLIHGN